MRGSICLLEGSIWIGGVGSDRAFARPMAASALLYLLLRERSERRATPTYTYLFMIPFGGHKRRARGVRTDAVRVR